LPCNPSSPQALSLQPFHQTPIFEGQALDAAQGDGMAGQYIPEGDGMPGPRPDSPAQAGMFLQGWDDSPRQDNPGWDDILVPEPAFAANVEEDSDEDIIFFGEISGCCEDSEEEEKTNETQGQGPEEPGGHEANAIRLEGPEEPVSEGVKEPKEIATQVDQGQGVEEVKAEEAEELKQELEAVEAERAVPEGPNGEGSMPLETEGANKPQGGDSVKFLQDWMKALRLW